MLCTETSRPSLFNSLRIIKTCKTRSTLDNILSQIFVVEINGKLMNDWGGGGGGGVFFLRKPSWEINLALLWDVVPGLWVVW
jgi:hypothetical protein